MIKRFRYFKMYRGWGYGIITSLRNAMRKS